MVNKSNNDNQFLIYHSWLIKRSLKGWLYRKFYLYPKINNFSKGKILDVGCGIGDYVKHTRNAYGVDVNKYNVKYCQNRNLNVLVMPYDEIPHKNKTFDTVLIDNVLEHIFCSFKLLDESLRVLKKSGVLIIGIPTLPHFFHDQDHKIFHSHRYMLNSMNRNDIIFKKFFTTPNNLLIQKYFIHTCRWYIFEKL